MKENHRTGLYYIIIGPVMEDERLEHSEMVFYALLSGLANSQGYCFASDEYLADRMRSKDRTVRDWLKHLEELGYIKRETTKNGMIWERKIYVIHGISNNSYERNSSAGSSGGDAVRSGGTVPDRAAAHRRIVSKENIVSKVKREVRAPVSKKKEKIGFGEHAKLTQEEYDSLVKDYGEEKTLKYIHSLNDYVTRIRGKPYLDDNLTIRKWIKDDKYNNLSQHTTQELKSFFDAFKEEFKGHPQIILHADSVEFLRGASTSLFAKFDENGKVLILERLKVMGLR